METKKIVIKPNTGRSAPTASRTNSKPAYRSKYEPTTPLEPTRPEMTDESAALYRASLVSSGQVAPSTEELRFDDLGALCMSKERAQAARAKLIQAGQIKPETQSVSFFKPKARRA